MSFAADPYAFPSDYVAEIRRTQPHGPYRLLGTSLGGVLVLEMACRLRALGDPVSLVAMVDTAPPTCVRAGRVDGLVLGPWGDGEVLFFRCLEPSAPADDRRRLWAEFAAAVRIVDVPGIHGRFHEEPQLSVIVEALRARLDERGPDAPVPSLDAEARA